MHDDGIVQGFSQLQVVSEEGFLRVPGRVVVEEVQAGLAHRPDRLVGFEDPPDSVEVPVLGFLGVMGVDSGRPPEFGQAIQALGFIQ